MTGDPPRGIGVLVPSATVGLIENEMIRGLAV
jgi:hypothetical protein